VRGLDFPVRIDAETGDFQASGHCTTKPVQLPQQSAITVGTQNAHFKLVNFKLAIARFKILKSIGRARVMSNQNLLDEKAALEALSGDRQLLGELAVMFVEDVPGMLDELEEAADRQDIATACRIIHSLRGLCSTFFATDVVNLAFRLEHDVKSDNLESLRQGGIDDLKRSIDNLLKELRASGYVV
jgi:HPt (histidine-containing phosphotransfer) domain-containing protein